MSHLGLMSPCTKGNSWAPQLGLSWPQRIHGSHPRISPPTLSQCAAKIPQACSLEGQPLESCRDKRVETAH